jgi:hypothetical protein
VKILRVGVNNRRKAFEVSVGSQTYLLPFCVLDTQPTSADKVAEVYVDPEIGSEGFTYKLQSGTEDSVHIDHVLEYNRDPAYLKDLILYGLSVEARARADRSSLSKREIIRRLGTSASQFYRLVDPTNYRKSIGQMIALLQVLDCEVEVVVKQRGPVATLKGTRLAPMVGQE